MELRQYAHFGPGLVAVGLAIYGVGALAGNLAGGPFADRQGAQTVVTASLVALAIVLIVLGTLPRLTWCCWLALAFFPSAHIHKSQHIRSAWWRDSAPSQERFCLE